MEIYPQGVHTHPTPLHAGAAADGAGGGAWDNRGGWAGVRVNPSWV